MNQIIEEGSGEAYWKARVESQGKVWGAQADHPMTPGMCESDTGDSRL